MGLDVQKVQVYWVPADQLVEAILVSSDQLVEATWVSSNQLVETIWVSSDQKVENIWISCGQPRYKSTKADNQRQSRSVTNHLGALQCICSAV